MKLIFLDVDGVLNSEAWLLRDGWQAARRQLGWPAADADPACVARLNHLRLRAKAKLVVSSHWRGVSIPVTRERLAQIGIPPFAVYSQTPRLFEFYPSGSGLVTAVTRGMEICAWWAERPWPEPHDCQFVIIDDARDMEPYMDHLVQTDPAVGLTDADVARALALLEAVS